MKIQTFYKIPAKTAGLWKICLIFNEIFRKRRITFAWSIQFWVNFSVLVSRIDFILHILIILNGLNNLATKWLMLDHSKVTETHFWMIQSAKKEVFGHYPEFGVLDQLDIAYCDSTKCFLIIGNVTRSWRIIQKTLKYIFEWSRAPKRRFLAIFWDSGLCFSSIYLRC